VHIPKHELYMIYMMTLWGSSEIFKVESCQTCFSEIIEHFKQKKNLPISSGKYRIDPNMNYYSICVCVCVCVCVCERERERERDDMYRNL